MDYVTSTLDQSSSGELNSLSHMVIVHQVQYSATLQGVWVSYKHSPCISFYRLINGLQSTTDEHSKFASSFGLILLY